MHYVQKILNRVNRSKADGYTLPLLESREDAIKLSLEIGHNIKLLEGEDRLLFLMDLAEINRGLKAREEILSVDLEKQSAKITKIQENIKACARYFSSLTLGK